MKRISLILFLILIPAAAAEEILHFSFESIGNERINDESGNTNAQVTGARLDQGILGRSLSIDGGFAETAEIALEDFTISFWVKGTRSPKEGSSAVFSLDKLSMIWDGNRFQRGGFRFHMMSLQYPDLKPGIWYHLGLVMNASDASWYINGREVGNKKIDRIPIQGPLVIGGDGMGNSFDGSIDEFSIHDTASSLVIIEAFRKFIHPFDTNKDHCIDIGEALTAINGDDESMRRETAEWFRIGC